MIYIYANDSDLSVNSVIEWLRYYKVDYTRNNNFTKLNPLNNDDTIWVRKTCKRIESSVFKYNFTLTKDDINKIAKENGLLLPKNYTEIAEVKKVFKKKKKLIVKPKKEVTTLNVNDENLVNYTTLIDGVNNYHLFLKVLSENFVQEYIKADFELRVFFVKSKIFSCAVFRKTNSCQNISDIRFEIANSNVFYEKMDIPKHLINKILRLFKSLDIDFGCIDFIVKKNQYYFLEINQMGQFEEYSQKANLNIEREIVTQILNNGKKILS